MLPYLKLLIRQRITAWNPVNRLRPGQPKIKTLLACAGFGLVAILLYAMLCALEYFLFGAFATLGEPQTMLALTGVLCTVLTVFTSFFYILSELFFSGDLMFVSSLPISSRGLFTAKLLRIWFGEAGIALLICLPVVILYGVRQAEGAYYYVKALLLIPFLPLAPITVVTLLSFLLIRVSALWKRRDVLTVIMSMLLLVAFMWLDMRLSLSSSEEDMGAAALQLVLRQKQVLDMIAGLYPPIQWFCGALTGRGGTALLQWLGFAALNAATVTAVVLALGGGYQRLAIRQNETFVRMNASAHKHGGKTAVRTPLRALYRREIREILTVPVYAMNCLASSVMFPLIAGVMMAGANSGAKELAMLPALLLLVPRPLMTAIATAVFCLTATMNMAVSTAVSREGKRHEFYRTLPVKPQTLMNAKLLMGLTINLICALPIAAMVFAVLPAFRAEVALGFLLSLLFSTVTTVTALMIDANHPKFGWKSETEAIKQNMLAAMSMFGSMGFLAACVAACYGLTALGLTVSAALTVLCATAALLDAALVLRLRRHTSNTYILQEVRI